MFSVCTKSRNCLRRFVNIKNNPCTQTNRTFITVPQYEQGQSPEKKIREYFYYIDHQGMVGKSMVIL